ncbi:hypothetical protein KVR01_010109 [Diaporthe batatas]|uniref:uncharacterized protein n=1 Tax=Diaporthe batatas TaxID=748121 RepID=UPI001D046172|nr:uncharacterized protein KVR01_010109 [Diaporthe batatas]KAG8160573.1 hypothetical protein KVR01_010109 [Diaporthe batatas]
MAPTKSEEVPKAVDFNQFMNKASLALSNHRVSLGRHLKSRPSSSEHHATEKPKSSFSSLANKASPYPDLKKSQLQRKKFSQPRAMVKDEDDYEEAPDNSGIGHVPTSKEAAGDARAAETRDLKGKLLGKRAMEQREEARKKRARAKENSGDEEEGRSTAVGRGKKKKGRSGGSE